PVGLFPSVFYYFSLCHISACARHARFGAQICPILVGQMTRHHFFFHVDDDDAHLHDAAAVRQDPARPATDDTPSHIVDSTTTTTRLRGHALVLDGTRVYSTARVCTRRHACVLDDDKALRKHALSDSKRQCRCALAHIPVRPRSLQEARMCQLLPPTAVTQRRSGITRSTATRPLATLCAASGDPPTLSSCLRCAGRPTNPADRRCPPAHIQLQAQPQMPCTTRASSVRLIRPRATRETGAGRAPRTLQGRERRGVGGVVDRVEHRTRTRSSARVCDVERVAAAGTLRETVAHRHTDRRTDAARGVVEASWRPSRSRRARVLRDIANNITLFFVHNTKKNYSESILEDLAII
ncbi:hypothetical protein DFH11DRAFT_1773767, partial [Phellopilus nigrolimitatus]